MANGSGTDWKKLTRGDLAQFDDVATEVVLYAMERGATGRLSRRGHVIIRGPGGGTMSVPKDGNRSQQVLELTVRKLCPDEPTNGSSTTTRISPDEHIRRIQEAIVPNPELECTVPGCEAVFVTEGARYTHLQTKHHVCPHPGCMKAGDHKAGIEAHYRIVHQGWRPAAGPHGKKRRNRKAVPTSRSSQVLAFLKSRKNEVVTLEEIRAAVEGVDGTTVANAMKSRTGNWSRVTRVRRGAYVYGSVPETTTPPPTMEETTPKVEPTTVEPGDAVMLSEIHAWVVRERDTLRAVIAQLEQDNDQLRRSLDAVRQALREE